VAPRLRLIGRAWCHLCDDMRLALEALRHDCAFDLELLDVDADHRLLARYDTLVPVLTTVEGDELCHYVLDAAKVREYLGRFG